MFSIHLFLLSIGVMCAGLACCIYATWSLQYRKFEKEADVVGFTLIIIGGLGAWIPLVAECFR